MKRKKKLILILTVLSVLIVFCWLQNNLLEVSYYTYTSDKLSQEFEGYRIVQISDLHNATFGADNDRLLKRLEELSPDMVVITGDMVDSSHTDMEVALSFARRVAATYPTYYVTGNHENWLEESERLWLLDGLRQVGVVCLEDEAVELQKDGSSIVLVGLNDESLSGPTLKLVLSGIDSENNQENSDVNVENSVFSEEDEGKKQEGLEETGNAQFQILLAHEPQYLENYSACDVDLVLTGHAHGGQFRIPFIDGGLVAPDQGFFPKYTEGVHVMNETTMIISRGLGNSVIPVRLFNLPEIVCVDLKR